MKINPEFITTVTDARSKRFPIICIYCDHWQNGGVEAYLMNLFRFWDFSKLNCELVTSQAETDLYDKELEKLGIRHIITLKKSYRSPILRILHNLSAVRTLFTEKQYDAVYLNLSNSFTMIYACLARHAGIPVRIVHSHCAGIKPSFSLPIKQTAHIFGRALFKRSVSAYFACSELAARWMFGNKKVRSKQVNLVNNAIDVSAFAKNAAERQLFRNQLYLTEKWVIGTVGRFTEQKNPFFLIHAFEQLARSRKDACLLWVGEGELLEPIRQYAQSTGIADRVILYGKTNHVARCLWSMDVFCLPSRFEGNPVSIIEAQAAGCICLVSDKVTQECKVSDNVRFLPIDQGINAWADAMANAKPTCDARQAARQVKENGYDAIEMSHTVQTLITQALHRKRSDRGKTP